MNLRTQMLLAGALTLAVPVIGWQSARQLDESLRHTRVDAQSLTVANARLALAESDELRSVLEASRAPGTPTDFYAEQARFPLFIDGYADEWQNLSAQSVKFKADGNQLSVRLATRNNSLYLFLDIKDENVVYHLPPAPRLDLAEGETQDKQAMLVNGDSVELLVSHSNQRIDHALFRTAGPGPLTAVSASAGDTISLAGTRMSRYRGFWAATPEGFHLELQLPLPPASSRIGLAFIDVDDVGERRTRWLGTLDPSLMALHHAGSLDAETIDAEMINAETINTETIIAETVSAETIGAETVSAETISAETINAENSNNRYPGNLFYASTVADERLRTWVARGTRARLFDRQGRLLSDVNSLYEKTEIEYEYDPAERGFLNAILFRIFAYFVADPEIKDQPFALDGGLHLPSDLTDQLALQEADTTHYVTDERDVVLGSLVPIGGVKPTGFLLFESNENLASAYSSSRVARLFSLLTLVSLLAGLVLLLYASILSMRIRSLSRLATRAVADDGRVKGIPQSDAKDEIGDLSRNLSALLERSANYTKYLEALSSRLSHELRTPLSVVQTSIENMDRDKLDAETITLMDRASGGADQLGAIIRALVESTRLEQTVQRAQMERIDLLDWFKGSLARYKQVYPDVSITAKVKFLTAQQKHIEVVAADELLQQAFDKLVNNAVGFSTDKQVALLLESFEVQGKVWVRLAVANNGPPIAQERQKQLFDPMFSERDGDDGELHLGLGLYIVRIIAEAHQGEVSVTNTISGVQVGFIIPQ